MMQAAGTTGIPEAKQFSEGQQRAVKKSSKRIYAAAVIIIIAIIAIAALFMQAGRPSAPRPSSVATTSINSSAPTTIFQTTTIPQHYAGLSGYISCIGPSYNATSELRQFAYAPISSSGTLGAWSTPIQAPIALLYPSCFSASGNFYCINGFTQNFSSEILSLYMHVPDTSGTQNATTPYQYSPIPICTSYENMAFCISANTSSASSQQYVYEANASASGLSQWKQVSKYPVSNYVISGCTTYSGNIYCVGGYETNASGETRFTQSVYYSSIYANGSLTKWRQTTSFPIPITQSSCTAYNGYLYCTGSMLNSSIYYSKINPNGSIQPWNSVAYPAGIKYPSCGALDGYIYCMGGINSTSASVNYTFIARLNSNGSIAGWQRAPEFPAAPVMYASAACAVS